MTANSRNTAHYPKISKERLYRDVEFLTSIRPWRNYQNLESLEKVCDYLRKEFSAAGYKTEDQKWLAEGREYTNIIASWNPEANKRLVLGAHYDVAGDQPGADDNASGVAGLLETARFIAQLKPQLDYRIDFVAYCLEEPPFFTTPLMGSYIHAQSLSEGNAEVIGMISYEMLGYFSEEPQSQGFPDPALEKLYPKKGNFIIVVGIDEFEEFNKKVYQLMAGDARIDVQKISFPSADGLAARSDQRNYWPFGYPALMVNDTSFLRNPNYHLESDRIDTLDFDKMTAVVESLSKAVCRF